MIIKIVIPTKCKKSLTKKRIERLSVDNRYNNKQVNQKLLSHIAWGKNSIILSFSEDDPLLIHQLRSVVGDLCAEQIVGVEKSNPITRNLPGVTEYVFSGEV